MGYSHSQFVALLIAVIFSVTVAADDQGGSLRSSVAVSSRKDDQKDRQLRSRRRPSKDCEDCEREEQPMWIKAVGLLPAVCLLAYGGWVGITGKFHDKSKGGCFQTSTREEKPTAWAFSVGGCLIGGILLIVFG